MPRLVPTPTSETPRWLGSENLRMLHVVRFTQLQAAPTPPAHSTPINMPLSRVAELEYRVEEYEEAIATFARLHEELMDLRANVILPEAAARIDSMLKLNAETLHSIKQSLTIAFATLKRAQQAADLTAANR